MFSRLFKIQKDLIKIEKIYLFWLLAVIISITEFFLARKIAGLDTSISNIDNTFKLSYLLIIMCLILALINYIMNYFVKIKNLSYCQKIRTRVVDSFSKDDYKTLEDYTDGEILNKLISDIPTVVEANVNSIISILSGGTLFISALVFGFFTSIPLTLLILLLSFFAVIIPKYFNEKLEKSWQQRQENQEESNTLLLQIFNSKILINSLNSENFLMTSLKSKYLDFTSAQYENTKLQYLMMALSVTFGLLFDVLTLCFSFYLIYINKLTIGGFIAFSILNKNFTWIFYDLPTHFVAFKRSEVSFDRTEKFLNARVEQNNFTDDFKEVYFNNVSYCYDKELILENIKFRLIGNDKILLIGESGSGKSTFIKLLLDFYKPVSGKITVNGNKNNSRYYSYVPQKIEIFNTSIRDNITLGRKISDDDIFKILEKLEITDFILSLEKGLDTLLDTQEKINLSAGQLQKIGIARALVEKNKVLVLDEIFANVDEESEKSISRLLKESNIPIILISHKIGNLSSFMKIYRIENKSLVRVSN